MIAACLSQDEGKSKACISPGVPSMFETWADGHDHPKRHDSARICQTEHGEF